MDYYTKSVEQSFKSVQSSPQGLSKTEIAQRQSQYGLNEIVIKGEPLWRKIIEPFASVFMLVLFVAVVMSLWHHEYVDAIIIGAIIAINAIIYYVQRISTERILRALQKRDRTLVDVIRDNSSLQVDASQLVPGDIVMLDEGEKVPADCRLISVDSLRVDESQLTGESLPIEKSMDALSGQKEVYEQTNMVYQGSFIVGGHATALVVETGNTTEFGKLASLSANARDESPVQRRIDALLSILIRVIAAVAAVAFLLSLYRGMEVSEAIRYVLALSVSAVPESLPIAITVVLVLGMRRMAAKKALVKTQSALETIGIVTAIASDKTGTLTKNMLTVQQTWHGKNDELSIIQAMANSVLKATSKTRDPLDTAMELCVVGRRFTKPHVVAILPFDQAVAMSGNIIARPAGLQLWVKGAPEHIVEQCKLSKSEETAIYDEIKSMAGNGLRVLALGMVSLKKPIDSFEALPKRAMTFCGLIGVADVLRREAPAAIRQAHEAGIRVYMVTGDHFETAFHIGKQLGIVASSNEVFDSRKMRELSDDELSTIVEQTRVFARVLPEDKHRLLTILKQNQVTAMTGDGVNDVPALTGAHVGVAMGSGTSIAKDAGDIILLDNNFRSIVRAIGEGRTIYANIKRMVMYLLATNAGEVMVALGALLLGVPVPLVAVQILWVNLVTDSCMVIPIGLEPGEKYTMKRAPIKPNAALFSHFMLSRIAVIALTMATLTLVAYQIFIDSHSVPYAQAIVFNMLVVMQWANAFNVRSDYEPLWRRIRRRNIPFYCGLAVAVILQVLAFSGFMHTPLHLHATPSVVDVLTTSIVAFVTPIIVSETHKWIGRHFLGKGVKVLNKGR